MKKINRIILLLSLPLCLLLFSCKKKTSVSTSKDITTSSKTKVITKNNKTTKANQTTNITKTTNKITTKKITTNKTTTEYIDPIVKTTEIDRLFKYDFEKDRSGNVLKVVRSYKDVDLNKYVYYYMEENEYNDSNELIESLIFDYDEDNNKWLYYEKNCYSYSNNRKTITNYSYSPSTNEFSEYKKLIYEYYDDKRIKEFIKMDYDSDINDFKYVEKNVYTYPDSTTKIDLHYTYENDNWIEKDKDKYIYNSNGQVYSYYKYYKKGDGFERYYALDYVYDDTLLYSIESELIGNDFIQTYKYVPLFDEGGYDCGRIIYVIDNDVTQEFKKETYITDIYGYKINRVTYGWDNIHSIWV